MMSRHKEELTKQTETESCAEEDVGIAEDDLKNAEDDLGNNEDDPNKLSNVEALEEVVENVPDAPLETPDDSSVETSDVPLVENNETDSKEQTPEPEPLNEQNEETTEKDKE